MFSLFSSLIKYIAYDLYIVKYICQFGQMSALQSIL